MTTPCVCPAAGYCATHRRASDPPEGRTMSEVRHGQCATQKGYYEAFQLDKARSEGKPPVAVKSRPQSERKRFRGIGDVIEFLLKLVGIHQLVTAAAKAKGAECGCAARRDKLNEAVPFGPT